MTDNRIMISWSLRCSEYKTLLALSETHRIFLAHTKAEFRCTYTKRKIRKILIKICNKFLEVMVLDIFNVLISNHQSFVSP